MMKAAIYSGKNDIQLEEKKIPAVGAKNVLIRNLRGGISGSDINIVKDDTGNMGITLGSEFGHEMVGEVVEFGSGVSSAIKVGMHVDVNPIMAKKVGRRKSLECGEVSQYVLIENAVLNDN